MKDRERKEYAIDIGQAFAVIGFPKRHRATKITNPDTAWDDKCDAIAGAIGDGVLLALMGKRGTGKTQMVVEACKRCLQGQVVGTDIPAIKYVCAMGIFIDIRGSYRNDSQRDESAIIRDHCKPQVLIIDEMHERGESQWEDRILTHIIDTRYADLKDTILISNQTADEFAGQMGPSIMSRLTETGGIIVCDWESFRK